MKFVNILLLFFISIAIVGAIFTSLIILSSANDIVSEQLNEYVSTVINDRSLRLDDYFSEKEKDIVVMSQSPYVVDFFEKQVSIQQLNAKKDVKYIAERVTEELDAYLLSNPKTLKQLQNDSVFQSLAVQEVGLTGYTAVTDYDSLISLFHSNPKIVNLDLHSLSDKLPEFWSIMRDSKGGLISEGFYDWKEADGSIRKKYMYIQATEFKTSDGVGLSVASTTYVDEYSFSFDPLIELESYLKTMIDNYDYVNIGLISKEGRVLWDRKHSGLESESVFKNHTNLDKIYDLISKNDGVQFTDIFSSNYFENPYRFTGAGPVYDSEGTLLGYILVVLPQNHIELLIESSEEKQNLELYVVGSDKELRTSYYGKDKTYSPFEYSVNSEIVNDCLSHSKMSSGELKEHHDKKHLSLLDSVNLDGLEVLGTGKYLPDRDWCIIGELDKKSVIQPLKEEFLSLSLFNLGIILFLLIVGSLVLAKYLTSSIHSLTESVDKLSKGDLDVKLPKSKIDEIRNLSSSLKRILTSLKLAVLKVGVRKEELNLGEVVKAKEEAEKITKKREEELIRFSKLAIGREHMMIKLKKENNDLKKKLLTKKSANADNKTIKKQLKIKSKKK